MDNSAVEYQPLVKESFEEELHESHRAHDSHLSTYSSRVSYSRLIGPITVIIISISLNAVLGFLLYSRSSSPYSHSLPTYAPLSWNVSGDWAIDPRFFNQKHMKAADQSWDSIEWEHGVVALSDEEITSLGLRPGRPVPWDDSRGIYVLNAYHNLHCLKELWKSIARWRDGGVFEGADWHNFHCLDNLRQDTICHADDTPRYVHKGIQEGIGNDQGRFCRDWAALDRWTKERSACYRFLDFAVEDLDDRYKFCERGSIDDRKMKAMYGPDEHERLVSLYGKAAVL